MPNRRPADQARSRLKQFGTNEIAREKRQSAVRRLLSNIKNPLVLLLLALGTLSFFTGDLWAMTVIFTMVVLGVVLRFFQETRADDAVIRFDLNGDEDTISANWGAPGECAPKTRNSVPRHFWDRVVGAYEFDPSMTERCKALLGDYLRASPEHHRASLDN
ncbi:MAG TPA: cation-transporting P-type ATPase [Chthoniobacterales bacterium]|nr:cation-transporting P-type ATPase [Chthoniobacterales bacterium]